MAASGSRGRPSCWGTTGAASGSAAGWAAVGGPLEWPLGPWQSGGYISFRTSSVPELARATKLSG